MAANEPQVPHPDCLELAVAQADQLGAVGCEEGHSGRIGIGLFQAGQHPARDPINQAGHAAGLDGHETAVRREDARPAAHQWVQLPTADCDEPAAVGVGGQLLTVGAEVGKAGPPLGEPSDQPAVAGVPDLCRGGFKPGGDDPPAVGTDRDGRDVRPGIDAERLGRAVGVQDPAARIRLPRPQGTITADNDPAVRARAHDFGAGQQALRGPDGEPVGRLGVGAERPAEHAGQARRQQRPRLLETEVADSFTPAVQWHESQLAARAQVPEPEPIGRAGGQQPAVRKHRHRLEAGPRR